MTGHSIHPYYNMDATRFKIVEHETDLGIVIDSKLDNEKG